MATEDEGPESRRAARLREQVEQLLDLGMTARKIETAVKRENEDDTRTPRALVGRVLHGSASDTDLDKLEKGLALLEKKIVKHLADEASDEGTEFVTVGEYLEDSRMEVKVEGPTTISTTSRAWLTSVAVPVPHGSREAMREAEQAAVRLLQEALRARAEEARRQGESTAEEVR